MSVWHVRSPVIWVLWLTVIPTLAIITFAVPETLAMLDEDGLTLSQFVYTLFSSNLLLLFVVSFNGGGLIYGLAVHFFWHWVPKEKRGYDNG